MIEHPRYYQIAGITIKVEGDQPFEPDAFADSLEKFRIHQPGEDLVSLYHHAIMPDVEKMDLGNQVYRKPPWAIYQQEEGWLYLGILPDTADDVFWKIAQFNHDHSVGHIYHSDAGFFSQKEMRSLTSFPTDQILVARLLADRQAFFLHSAGAIINGCGLLFVGHSEAGKSTITQMLVNASNHQPQEDFNLEILGDDRNIVRSQEGQWRVYGSWSHGDVPLVSPASTSLRAIGFLEQANENTLTPLTDTWETRKRLLATIIRPLVGKDWWGKTLDLVEQLLIAVPIYRLRFDKSGAIVPVLQDFLTHTPPDHN